MRDRSEPARLRVKATATSRSAHCLLLYLRSKGLSFPSSLNSVRGEGKERSETAFLPMSNNKGGRAETGEAGSATREPARMLGITVDITERKHAEQMLRESRGTLLPGRQHCSCIDLDVQPRRADYLLE